MGLSPYKELLRTKASLRYRSAAAIRWGSGYGVEVDVPCHELDLDIGGKQISVAGRGWRSSFQAPRMKV